LVANPLTPFLKRQGVVILDGGLATEFEARGCDLNDPLWSAKVLLDDPELVKAVHLDYLRAGADCIASASYQASFPGLERRGLDHRQGAELMRQSVRLAVEARDEFWGDGGDHPGRLRPLVAASVGPYGAYLADGSEYTGDYGVDRPVLSTFHLERWHVLAESGADIMVCETIPSALEAQILLELLRLTPDIYAWFSFSCRDEERISDGTPLVEVVSVLEGESRVAAVGVNCTAPSHIPDLIRCLLEVTRKPIVVYPNSGETYDAEGKCWLGETDPVDFGSASAGWIEAGATIIGGCCRTGPDHIRAIRNHVRA
jgi:homocysteine S-methyltransferase